PRSGEDRPSPGPAREPQVEGGAAARPASGEIVCTSLSQSVSVTGAPTPTCAAGNRTRVVPAGNATSPAVCRRVAARYTIGRVLTCPDTRLTHLRVFVNWINKRALTEALCGVPRAGRGGERQHPDAAGRAAGQAWAAGVPAARPAAVRGRDGVEARPAGSEARAMGYLRRQRCGWCCW